MKYAYLDLGEQAAGSTVQVTVRGGGAKNVLVLTSANFVRYQADRSFRYLGGRYRGQPVRIKLPQDDHWYAVMEIGTYNGRARAAVEVLPAQADQEPQREVVEV